MKLRLLSICLPVLFLMNASAQHPASFATYNIKGLPPKSIVTSIYQDKEGFLWFGGMSGLYRYDGNILLRYQHKPGDSTTLPHNYILDFCEDVTGNLVLGTLGGGLCVFDKRTEKTISLKGLDSLPEVKDNGLIFSVSRSSFSDAIWCGTAAGTVLRYDPLKHHVERVMSISTVPGSNNKMGVTSILEISKNKLLIATLRGLYYLDLDTRKILAASSLNADFNKRDSSAFHTLFADGKNRVWIGSEGRIDVIDSKTFATIEVGDPMYLKQFAGLTVSAFTNLNQGTILTGTDKGIFSWNEDEKIFKSLAGEDKLNQSIRGVNRFYKDPLNNTWIATEGQGIFLLNKNYDFFKTIPGLKELLGAGKSNFIFEDDSRNWWIGTEQGLAKYNPSEKKLRLISFPGGKNHEAVFSIFQDNNRGIWLGTASNGLYRIADPDKPEVMNHYASAVIDKRKIDWGIIYAICADQENNIWIGTRTSGLIVFNPSTGTFKRPGGNDPVSAEIAVSDILKDRKNRMWVSTLNRGIFRFDAESDDPLEGKFTNYTTDPANTNSLSFFITIAMKEDDEGNIWIATVSAGVNKFDPDKNRFTRYSTDNDLPSNLVYEIEQDKNGNIWLSTDEGLAMIPRNGGGPVNYKEEDGLVTRAFNFLASSKMKDGTIAFGTVDGDVVFFQPSEGEKNEQAPAIVDFKLFNQPIKAGEQFIYSLPLNRADTFKLKYNQSVFTFEFTNFDLINSENYAFAYKLDGVDKDWNYITNRKSASYTNLSPGKYLFHLKSANHSGIWSEKESSAWVIVSPPWWRTWWAYLIYAVAIIAGVNLFIRYRSRQLRIKNQQLEHQVNLRTNELKESLSNLKSTQAQLIQAEKMASLGELTSGIAHEIQNPLNFVNNFSEVSSELIDELDEALGIGFPAGQPGQIATMKNQFNETVDGRQLTVENSLLISDLLSEVKQNLSKINHHGKRADAIVKGMLQHSQSRSGIKEPTDINKLTEEYLRVALNGFRIKHPEFDPQIKTSFDQLVATINVVPQEIGKVLFNVMTNAFYAVNTRSEKLKVDDGNYPKAGEYHPEIWVSTKRSGHNVEIRISDNGGGIPEAIASKIFQPFFTTKPTGQGTGLGLSLAYDIIKAHGGEIKTHNDAGGAVFVISLHTVS